MADDQMLDLDAFEVEENGTPFGFQFDGARYELPFHPDMRAIARLDAGDLEGFLSKLLGEEQWQQLLDSPKTLTAPHLGKLIDAYFDHVGVAMGKSSGSTAKSGRTVAPSKRTSNGSTASGSRRSRQVR